jgi:hypothetical protein
MIGDYHLMHLAVDHPSVLDLVLVWKAVVEPTQAVARARLVYPAAERLTGVLEFVER